MLTCACARVETDLCAQLAALLHDIADWKYSGSESAGAEQAAAFLKAQCFEPSKITQVCDIINGVSFHSELGGAVVLVCCRFRETQGITPPIYPLTTDTRACYRPGRRSP